MLTQTGVLLVLHNASLHLRPEWLNWSGICSLERPTLSLHEGLESSGEIKNYINWFRSSKAQIEAALPKLSKAGFIEKQQSAGKGESYQITPLGKEEIATRLAKLPTLEEEQVSPYPRRKTKNTEMTGGRL
jgi:hypothetical protein